MSHGKLTVPGNVIAGGKNRSNLQSMVQTALSPNPSSQQISACNPSLILTLTVRQTWSAHPDRPLTICTRFTPLNVAIAGRSWTGTPLSNYIAYSQGGSSWKRLVEHNSALRRNFKYPSEEDWQKSVGFVTLPSLDSGESITITREVDISSLSLSKDETLRLRLDDTPYDGTPGIEWWNWGALNAELKDKRLGYVTDPVLNEKSREEEARKIPKDLVLGYENWKDGEDEEGNEMVWLEIEYHKRSVEVEFGE